MTTLAQIRLRACKLWPYGSHAILSLVPVSRPGLGTLAVDQHWRLYFDPQAVAERPLEQTAGVALHEVYHLLLKHHRRAERLVGTVESAETWRRWNEAADYAVNSMLRDQGIALWDGMLCPVKDGLPPLLSAEDYFRRLTDQSETTPQSTDTEDGGANAPPNQTDDGEAESSGDSQRPNSEEDANNTHGAPNECGDNAQNRSQNSQNCPEADQSANCGNIGSAFGESESLSGDSECPTPPVPPGEGGSCADGRPRRWELPAPTDCDTPGMAPHEADIIASETAKRILDKGRGTSGGAWQRWAENILTPRIDPRLALLRHVRAAVEQSSGLGDYSFRRPNRRNPRADMLLPSNVQPIPRITVVVDTSGSMDQRDLGLCLGLIGKVLNGFRIRDGIRVVTGDVQAVTAARVFDPRQVRLAGGGGTAMGALIREVAQAKPKPQLIVVATDGATTWCDPVPVPVVACLTRPVSEVWPVPAWVRRIVLDERAAA